MSLLLVIIRSFNSFVQNAGSFSKTFLE